MAVLGNGGVLEISREIPDAIALSSARVNTNTISLNNQAYWAGDHVVIAGSDGVPVDVNGDGYADCPDGHGFYRGSAWDLGPALAFYTGGLTDGAPFYDQFTATDTLITQAGDTLITQSGDTLIGLNGSEDDNDRYNTAATTGLATQVDGYMSRDVLDRIRLWSTEAEGHSESGTEKPISLVNPGNFVIAHYDGDASYTSAIDSAANSIKPLTLASSEQRLEAVITLPAGFEVVCDDANRDWKLQCDLQEWVMSIDAANLDTTAIGETFGEHVKALVRGAGNLQFIAEHKSVSAQEDSLALLRLVLLTHNQCNTKARFYLYKDRTTSAPKLDGSVYYECDILLTNTRLNTRATEIIAGTADFVATSEIKLKVIP
jgi:hypothetical protein